jgi:DNA polymerase-3 subunit beta
MKIVTAATELGAAIELVASVVGAQGVKGPVFAAARLNAIDGGLAIAGSSAHAGITVTIKPNKADGAVAVPARRLADLIKHFGDAELTITATDKLATISSGRSYFKLPTIPLNELPASFTLGEETGRVTLVCEAARDLFRRPAFAVGTEKSRYDLAGVFLHEVPAGLAGVATDGVVLARVIVHRGDSSLSRDRSLIVPTSALKIIGRLLEREVNEVTLRRSKTLVAIVGEKFEFVSRLVDSIYPTYEQTISEPASAVIVDRTALSEVLARFAAVADPQTLTPRVTLSWGDSELHLRAPDGSEDIIPAEVSGGPMQVTLSVGLLAEQITQLRGDRVMLGSGGMTMASITDPDDASFLTMLAAMRG